MAARCGAFLHVLYCSLSYCCVKWILSSILITLLGKRELAVCFSLVIGLCTVCYGLFVLPRSVIARLYPVIVAIPGNLLYYYLPSF